MCKMLSPSKISVVCNAYISQNAAWAPPFPQHIGFVELLFCCDFTPAGFSYVSWSGHSSPCSSTACPLHLRHHREGEESTRLGLAAVCCRSSGVEDVRLLHRATDSWGQSIAQPPLENTVVFFFSFSRGVCMSLSGKRKSRALSF